MHSIIQDSLIIEAGKRGIGKEEVYRQLKLFKTGTNPVRLDRPCTIGDGILSFSEAEVERLRGYFESNQHNIKIIKFTPASGAATRMFKNLEALLEKSDEIGERELDGDDPDSRFGKTFISNIRKFAFWDDLKRELEKDGFDADALLEEGNYHPLIFHTLKNDGLGYSEKPKALIKFHKYDGDSRTSLEEHLHEGVKYGMCKGGKINLHFTISPEHRDGISRLLESALDGFGDVKGYFEIGLSVQDPSTDTIAVTMENEPFVDDDGGFLFRPGGHGALLANLNRLEADVVFIKNIDNVVPDYLKDDTVIWKKVLGGYLLWIVRQVHGHLNSLNDGECDTAEILKFCKETLNLDTSQVEGSDDFAQELKKLLNRPIRVCGMVKNEGEPGGGPFWVRHEDGRCSLQIVETSQIDTSDPGQNALLLNATHFNPVDLACCLNDHTGKPFDLERFVNPQTAFIAEKSKNGRKLKALERPGLWNGAMEHWITVFVEVPITTFNPVKTVNDLLRPQHQPG